MKEDKTGEIARLLSLKAYEIPSEERVEKSVQNTMRAVREAHVRPSLHLFPDKSMAWMFAQPRYGIAALFILFLGLHMLRQPVPREAVADGLTVQEDQPMELELVAATETNSVPEAILAVPSIPQVIRPDYSALARPVSFTR